MDTGRRRRRRPPLVRWFLVMILLAAPVLLAPGAAAARGAAGGRTVIGGEALARAGVVVAVAPGSPAVPAPKAAAWLVADVGSGDVIAASGAHRPLAPASTLKVLTALALLPEIDREAVYTASAQDAAIDGSKVGLVPGSRYTVRDLLHGMLLGSGNDCASALARMAGGPARATTLMDRYADRLGALDTVPMTPSGLDAPGQVSSAYDLALAGRAALADPRIGPVMRTVRYRFPAGGAALGADRRRFEIQNHDRMLRNYPGAGGGKTGYTQAARHSYVGAATRGGRTVLVAMLRAEGQTWRQTAALMDWAFAVGPRARPVGTLVAPGTVATATSATPAAAVRVAGATAPGPAAATASGATTSDSQSGESLVAAASDAAERLLDAAGLPVGRWSWAVLLTLAVAAAAAVTLLVHRARLPR